MQYPLASEIAAYGYICAVEEYRLSPEEKYPTAVLDIKSSIKWLKKNSAEYSIDTNRIFISGYSSGGLLAALCGTTHDYFLNDSDDPIFHQKYAE